MIIGNRRIKMVTTHVWCNVD